MPSLTELLQSRYGLKDAVRFEEGAGGLTRAVLSGPAGEAHVYVHGAHVTHWQPTGQAPVLFMSQASRFEAGKPIRGGVPICFPWFGNHRDNPRAPAHGFARTMSWNVHEARVKDQAVVLELTLASNGESRGLFPHDFELTYRVVVGASLTMTLGVRNTGAMAFTFEEALHTYLSIEDVRRVAVGGLEHLTFIDKLEQGARRQQDGIPVRITGETDRIYLGSTGPCVISGAANGRSITIDKRNSNDTVVWNPWIDKAKAMADFGDDEWPRMICVETCNVGEHAVELQPGKSHEMTAVVKVTQG